LALSVCRTPPLAPQRLLLPLKYFVSLTDKATPAADTAEPVYTGESGRVQPVMLTSAGVESVRVAMTCPPRMTPAAASVELAA
jgi:hypothetical protein